MTTRNHLTFLLLTLSFAASAQTASKIFNKSFNTDNRGTIVLDLPGLIDLKIWDNPSIKFENISNGIINMTLVGLPAFRQQAEHAKNLFLKRQQTIKSYLHENDETRIEINYQATLAIDLPNGLKQGDELNLVGSSIFKFLDDRIIALTDIS